LSGPWWRSPPSDRPGGPRAAYASLRPRADGVLRRGGGTGTARAAQRGTTLERWQSSSWDQLTTAYVATSAARYDGHGAQSAGTDELTVTFTLRAATHADAIRSAGLAAGTLAELLTDNAAAVNLSGVALVVRAQ
jgi:hypothetical protein